MTKEHEESSGLGEPSEATLFRQAQAGCRDSLNALMERHAGLVAHVVNRQQRWGLPYEDALQAGRVGLWCAILGYDQKREAAFSTYAYVSIMHHVWAAVKRYRQQQDRELAVEELAVFFDRVTPDSAGGWVEEEIQHSLRVLVRRLPPRWRGVVVAHYGLDGQPPRTYQEIGARWGVSRQRVHQLAAGALAWLRHPAHSQELRSLLARHTQQQYELAEESLQAWLRQRGGRRHAR